MKRKLGKTLVALTTAVTLTACGSTGAADTASSENADSSSENAEANASTDQTEFKIMGGQSALSPGYTDNEVLNKLMEETGISIEWNTVSDSLSEQVNIQIAGGELPDAYMGVGFSNYDLSNYGDDG
ncbi:MAG: sugar ABC transporter substrate-binding protein, partial [Butyrivibrio sp.]|nr:sugar ABC transporter substrate-binding protein [Butyrivibrio sp.]